jgi:hypothetical protein
MINRSFWDLFHLLEEKDIGGYRLHVTTAWGKDNDTSFCDSC